MSTPPTHQPLPAAFRILIRRFNNDPRWDVIMAQCWTPRGWRDYCTCAGVANARDILESRGVHADEPVIRNRRTAAYGPTAGR